MQLTNTDLTAAALTQTFTLLSSAAPGVYVLYQVLDTPLSGGAIATAVSDVGPAANPDQLADNIDVFTGASIVFGPQIGDLAAVGTVYTTQVTADIEILLTTTVGDIDEATAFDSTYSLYRVA